MSTLDVRNNSAMMKRAEQLKRWEESDTNRAPATPRTENGRRIKFSSGCVFLAACLSSDKDEVLLLLSQGADINTANVDGLTGLHQACIDDNLEMVEFLVEHGADINRQDNEGWTPLHATASCGFVSIARYLVESGADVAAVNSDGDLALDLAIDTQHVPMIDYMSKVVQELNIDVEQARKAEEMAMLNDAKKWLRSDASEVDRPHPKTGATAMHVAAAKGYTKVLSLLLAGRANVDKQDNDGWTPLHGAAHWGQKETAEMLIESLADMDIRNYAGQTCIDIADRKMVKFLEELRANKRNKRRPSSQISRISDTIENHVDKTPTKIVRVEVRTDNTKDADNMKSNANNLQQQLYTNTDQQTVEDEAPWRRKTPRTQNDSLTKNQVPDKEVGNKTTTTTATTNTNAETNDVILRRTQSFENDQKFYQKYHELRARIKANSCPILPAGAVNTNTNTNANAAPNSNNNNNNSNSNNNNNNKNNITTTTTTKLGYANVNSSNITNTNINTNINTNTNTSTSLNQFTQPQTPTTQSSTLQPQPTTTTRTNLISTNQNYTVQRSASLKDNSMFNYRKPPATPVNTIPPASITTTTTTTSGTNTPTSATNNAPTVAGVIPPIRRSFVPPVRDEESETQRKAHAKRVRETRRSTQGVTLDEIKSAEELVKKKNLGMNNNNNNNNNSNNETQDTTTSTTTTTIDTTTTTSTQEQLEPQEPPPPPTSPPPSLIPEESTEIIETITTTATTPTSAEDDKIHTEIIKEDDIVTEILSDLADVDATATFTIAAPPVAKKRGSIQIADATDEQKQEEQERELERVAAVETSEQSADDAGMVSASYTIKAVRRGSVKITEPEKEIANESTAASVSKDNAEDNDNKADDEKQVKDENEKTDDVNDNDDNDDVANNETKINSPTATPTSAETLEVYQRPTELECTSSGLSIASYTPNSMPTSNSSSSLTSGHSTDAIIAPPIESPVRLRDKRALFVPLPPPGGVDSSESKYFGAGDVKTTSAATSTASTPTSASALSELNPRDSLINCYANLAINSRRSLDSVGVLQTTTTTAAAAAAAAAVGGDATTTTTSMAQREAGGAGGNTSISLAERRPSWRLKFDAGSKFKLEDVTSGVTFPAPNSTIIPSAPAVLAAANLTGSQRRISASNNSINASNQSLNSIGRPVSAPANETTTTTAYLTHARKYEASAAPTTPAVTSASSSTSLSSNSITSTPATTTSSSSSTITSASTTAADDKDNDKENDNRSAHMAIQRRRKPKRRSTGVVHIDMDEIDPDRHESSSANDNEDKEKESGSERTTRSRLGSTASNNAASNEISKAANNSSSSNKTENGDGIDYKALWEAAKLENDKLKQMLKQKDDEVVQTRATLERFTNATTKNSLSELEKRERRAMERKLSEMEEELKQLEVYKTDNHRLKEENAALIRVISKLSK